MGVVDQPLIDEVRMVRLSFGEGFEIFQLDLPSPSWGKFFFFWVDICHLIFHNTLGFHIGAPWLFWCLRHHSYLWETLSQLSKIWPKHLINVPKLEIPTERWNSLIFRCPLNSWLAKSDFADSNNHLIQRILLDNAVQAIVKTKYVNRFRQNLFKILGLVPPGAQLGLDNGNGNGNNSGNGNGNWRGVPTDLYS